MGRAEELERIARSRAAKAPGVVVLAPAGVGKSRLVRDALAQAERHGSVTVWVQATRSAATVPLGAFAGVIPAQVRSDDLFELLRGSAAAISKLAGTRPLVVGVDDAQLLDPTSAALVLHLVNGGGCFVMATVRTGELCPDAIVSLWKDARGRAARARAVRRSGHCRAGREHHRGSGRGGRASVGVGDQPGQRALCPRADPRCARGWSADRGRRPVAHAKPSYPECLSGGADLLAPGRAVGRRAPRARAARAGRAAQRCGSDRAGRPSADRGGGGSRPDRG